MGTPWRGGVPIAAGDSPPGANSRRRRETTRSTRNSNRTWKKITRVKVPGPWRLPQPFRCPEISDYLPVIAALLTLNGLAPVI